jgi:uncharacterized RDD family membrane protein YckC
MATEIVDQLANLATTAIVAAMVWNYYKDRMCATTELYATFAPRFWSSFADSLVLWPIGFVATALIMADVPRVLAVLLLAVENLAWLLYTVVMHARYGQTVGKMATKVRVVDFATEGQISWRQAWLREGIPIALSLGLVGYEMFAILAGDIAPADVVSGKSLAASKLFWILTTVPVLWFVAEVLTMLTNDKRRALHDFIAGTVVVRTNIEMEDLGREDSAAKLSASSPQS